MPVPASKSHMLPVLPMSIAADLQCSYRVNDVIDCSLSSSKCLCLSCSHAYTHQVGAPAFLLDPPYK